MDCVLLCIAQLWNKDDAQWEEAVFTSSLPYTLSHCSFAGGHWRQRKLLQRFRVWIVGSYSRYPRKYRRMPYCWSSVRGWGLSSVSSLLIRCSSNVKTIRRNNEKTRWGSICNFQEIARGYCCQIQPRTRKCCIFATLFRTVSLFRCKSQIHTKPLDKDWVDLCTTWVILELSLRFIYLTNSAIASYF